MQKINHAKIIKRLVACDMLLGTNLTLFFNENFPHTWFHSDKKKLPVWRSD
jgi:hypothetical protein